MLHLLAFFSLFVTTYAISRDDLLVVSIATEETDGYLRYDVVFIQSPEFILDKFQTFKPARVVFGAEDFCWPNPELQNEYPEVESNRKRFLNSGGFIGYANDIYELITSQSINDDEDDQLFYTKIFLNEFSRSKWSIVLDTGAEIFLNLNGAIEEIKLEVNGDEVYIHNTRTDSIPAIIHGNGPSKRSLNYLSNYLARVWSPTLGCLQCKENLLDVTSFGEVTKWPIVYMALFIEYPTPFLREYFENIMKINYPKERIGLFVHNQVDYHKNLTEQFLSKFKQEGYKFVKYLSVDDDTTEAEARQQAIKECQDDKCDYLFVVDSVVHLDHPDTLIQLMTMNRTVIAPMITRPGKTWANFWGDFSDDGYYKRSPDYLEIINHEKLGIFQVPHVAHCYLISGTLLQRFTPRYDDANIDPDVKFSISMRDSDWKARYIHPDYYKLLEPNTTIEQPCPDTYWFPVVTKEFSQSLIDMMEAFGGWSGSSHTDKRLAGGYENVPTDDIHMNQVGFDEHWLFFLRDVIQPIQQKLYTGYNSDPPRAALNFVVRYMPEYQSKLRPHHDASTYTINLALNDVGKDYEGGGCRFIRYNCSLSATRRGWTLMHPGRLTHLHEADTRHPAIQADLINCTWYKSEACCKRTEVASVFESMFTLHQCSTKCRNMINYMMCFFCDPNQFLWYIKRKVKVCGSFCNQLHKECKNAEYNGNVISVQYKSGKEFCEAQNFQVTSSDCFDFDENVFSKTMSFLKFKSYFLFILQILFCIYII
ncbi:unnamed protein product [Didymodactylos carnosus]|uniref:Fe2OG dioxygenase domain-containing protein n=1 Tax=Didymodactylos carnosus TaxID=1234261 RepID=A0A8S2DT36_9BILA|nr:unnamed protein product [Didymodactylos carnosus]CAF3816751.1 unnamed protein product [Didymodactylos carnosus]